MVGRENSGKSLRLSVFCPSYRRVHQGVGQFIYGYTPITPNHSLC
ncbi:hypothetical protein EDWATA_01062 [Edwardsiella tarda ATCC 23685]|uniref:Uncharacterized protein n=1 Tax=Edwardsiella tarda ATCC 23685 TaxID=500638 RepID=D4F2W1_EDWTA|nr:hypothetical protein EDWATA_01062 [Edwardsiella tarda ATCC 23685]